MTPRLSQIPVYCLLLLLLATFLLFNGGVQVARLLEPKPAELLDQRGLGKSEGGGEGEASTVVA